MIIDDDGDISHGLASNKEMNLDGQCLNFLLAVPGVGYYGRRN